MATSDSTESSTWQPGSQAPKRGVPEGLVAALPRLPANDLPQGSRRAAGHLPRVRLPLVRPGPGADCARCSTTERSKNGLPSSSRPIRLGFADKKPYAERLKAEQARTGLREAAIVGTGMIRARRVAFGVTDSAFIMGSMGAVVGEKLTRLIERATVDRLPLIIISASGGGARMHEGILSLMQMAKVSAALARYDQAGGLFISVLTNPTMGGVAASFASLGDVIFAEPKALIGFAGPRHDSGHDPHRAAQGISDQRILARARLHRPHRPPLGSEERDRPHDRLLRQVGGLPAAQSGSPRSSACVCARWFASHFAPPPACLLPRGGCV